MSRCTTPRQKELQRARALKSYAKLKGDPIRWQAFLMAQRPRSDSWKAKNPEKVRAYKRKRYYGDLEFRLAHLIRSRIQKAVKRGRKGAKSQALLGCSIARLRAHLESLFLPGMSWQNYGPKGWHIDHIRPCAAFNLLDPEQQRCCFHYTNLQPLWAKENHQKYDKVIA